MLEGDLDKKWGGGFTKVAGRARTSRKRRGRGGNGASLGLLVLIR